MTDTTAADPAASRSTSTRPATTGSRATASSCASRASLPCRSTRRTCAGPPSGSRRPCAAAGVEHVEVAETGGHPVVYGDWLHAEGAPTVLVYGHYDVQPVDPLDLWTSPPFEPVVVDGRMLARGAADDKGQIHAHAMAARALTATRGRLPDQRADTCSRARRRAPRHTSPHGWKRTASRLAADVAIISDTGFFEGNLPSITVSLRGLMYAQIDVVLSPVDLHSGGFGGAVAEPGQRPGPDHRRAQGSGRPGPHPRLLR